MPRIALSATFYRDTVMSLGPVGYWRLNGTTNDETVNANHGTVTGNNVRTKLRGPLRQQSSGAYGFTSPNGEITIPLHASYRATESFTWHYYVLPEAKTARKMATRNNATSPRITIGSSMDIRFDKNGSSTARCWTAGNVLAVGVGAWVTAFYDHPTKMAGVAVDGVIVATNTVTDASMGNMDTTGSMKISENSSSALDGRISEFAIFDRALTASEIKTLYDATQIAAPGPGITTTRLPRPRNALEARILSELLPVQRWREQHGLTGFLLGEVAVPNGRQGTTHTTEWNEVLEFLYQIADYFDWDVMYYSAAHSNDPVSPFGGATSTYTETFSPYEVIKRHPETASFRRGVNVSRPSRSQQVGAGALDVNNSAASSFSTSMNCTGTGGFSNVDPGNPVYDNLASLQYLYDKGIRTIRLCVRWERIQPTRGAALGGQWANIQTMIANCASVGLKVIFDVHNFGGYYIKHSDGKGYKHLLNVANATTGLTVTTADLVDLWQRLSAEFAASSTVVAYDLMNEPWQISYQNWEAASQTVLSAIRALGDTKLIYMSPVVSPNWTPWTVEHPNGVWWVDPANNTRMQHHYYPDRKTSGDFLETGNTYPETLADALARGFAP